MKFTHRPVIFALFLVLAIWANPAWASGDAAKAESEIKTFVAAIKSSPSAAAKKALRRAQAHLNVARKAGATGKGKLARAHALASRAELLAAAKEAGAKLTPLTKAEIAEKAGVTPAFTEALQGTPTADKLLTGQCTAPDYGWGCCWPGETPCSGECCSQGQVCGDHQCHSGTGTGTNVTTGETETAQ